MGDTVVALVLAADAVLELIDLVKKFIERVNEEQRDIKQNLVALKTDLGIIKDIVNMINRRNYLRELEGVKGWMEEASNLVNDADTLLKSIEAKNNCSKKRRRRNQEQFRCSKDDAKQLDELKTRCDQLAKNNGTILQLIGQNRRPFDWLLCGRCC